MELEFGEFQRRTEQLQLQLLGGRPSAACRDGDSLTGGQLGADWLGDSASSTAGAGAGQGPSHGWPPLLAEPGLGESFSREKLRGLPEPGATGSGALSSRARNPTAGLAGLVPEEASCDVSRIAAAGPGNVQSAWRVSSNALGTLSGEVAAFSQETQALLRQIHAISL